MTKADSDSVRVVVVDLLRSGRPREDMLRSILARELMVPEEMVQPARDQWGRLYLSPLTSHLSPLTSSVDISIAHSENLLAVGLIRGGRLGVDMEVMRPGLDIETPARDYLTEQERDELDRLPCDKREEAFLTRWTVKEAYLKALGLGLAVEMSDIETEAAGDEIMLRAVRGSGETASGWAVKQRSFNHAGKLIVLAVVYTPVERELEVIRE